MLILMKFVSFNSEIEQINFSNPSVEVFQEHYILEKNEPQKIGSSNIFLYKFFIKDNSNYELNNQTLANQLNSIDNLRS